VGSSRDGSLEDRRFGEKLPKPRLVLHRSVQDRIEFGPRSVIDLEKSAVREHITSMSDSRLDNEFGDSLPSHLGCMTYQGVLFLRGTHSESSFLWSGHIESVCLLGVQVNSIGADSDDADEAAPLSPCQPSKAEGDDLRTPEKARRVVASMCP
jgi:hypothetical protein